jgi:purine-nucleoside phosphorylase
MLHPPEGLEEGLIRPMRRRADPEVGPDAILAIVSSDLDLLLEAAHAGNRCDFDMGFFRLHRFEKKGGEYFSVLGPFLGAPHAVMGMEKIIALGAKRIWSIGWCGSLQPDLKIGDFVIPTGAICEEGTSAHYPIGDRPLSADLDLCGSIDSRLSQEGKKVRRGVVWTTDAPYRETPSKVLAYQSRGVLGVEMEMSALMTLAIYRSVQFAGLLVVSDELSGLTWRPGFRDPRFRRSRREAGGVMLGLVDPTVDLQHGHPES